MKKVAVLLFVLTIAFALCACNPSKEDIVKTLSDNDYKVDYLGSEYATGFGADEDEVEFIILARSKNNTHTLYIIGLTDKDAAKELYEEQSTKNYAGYNAIRKGKIVIFGDEDGVNMF